MSVQFDTHSVLLRLIEQLAGRAVSLLGSQGSIRLEQLDRVVVRRSRSVGNLFAIHRAARITLLPRNCTLTVK